MDKTDIKIIHRLLINSRVTYRELAEEVGLTVSTVHKRVKAMVEDEIIKNFTTELGIEYLGAVQVHFLGSAKISSVKELSKNFNEDEYTSTLHVGSNDYIHIGGLLKDMSELDEYTGYLEDKTGMKIEHIGLMTHSEYDEDKLKLDYSRSEKVNLSKADKRVITALHQDARKSISDVSDEIGLSAKTVKRSIDKLLENKVIEFSLDWNPSVAGDLVPLIHIYIDNASSKSDVYKILENKYSDHLIFNFMFHNIPSLIVSTGWVRTLKELDELKEELESEGNIKYVKPNLIFSGHHFKTWRDTEMKKILNDI